MKSDPSMRLELIAATARTIATMAAEHDENTALMSILANALAGYCADHDVKASAERAAARAVLR